MWLFILFMLSMCILDAINPITITFCIVLLGLLKKTNRISIYVFGIQIIYFVGGVFIFTGLSTIFDRLIELLALIPGIAIAIFKSVLGLICVIFGLAAFKGHNTPKKAPKETDISTWALIVLGAGTTLQDIPTAVPYLAFITRMTQLKFNMFSGILILLIYSLLYILPLVILWVLFLVLRDKIKDKLDRFGKKLVELNKYAFLILFELVGIFLIVDSVLFYIGTPIKW